MNKAMFLSLLKDNLKELRDLLGTAKVGQPYRVIKIALNTFDESTEPVYEVLVNTSGIDVVSITRESSGQYVIEFSDNIINNDVEKSKTFTSITEGFENSFLIPNLTGGHYQFSVSEMPADNITLNVVDPSTGSLIENLIFVQLITIEFYF